jgi:hypothetical protein
MSLKTWQHAVLQNGQAVSLQLFYLVDVRINYIIFLADERKEILCPKHPQDSINTTQIFRKAHSTPAHPLSSSIINSLPPLTKIQITQHCFDQPLNSTGADPLHHLKTVIPCFWEIASPS